MTPPLLQSIATTNTDFSSVGSEAGECTSTHLQSLNLSNNGNDDDNDDDDDDDNETTTASTTIANTTTNNNIINSIINGNNTTTKNNNKNDNNNNNQTLSPTQFRKLVRTNNYTGPTNGICPNYLQCNLVILPQKDAYDFLLFCQRNEKACPLIEVCDVGCSLPKYCCFNNMVGEKGSDKGGDNVDTNDDDDNDDDGEPVADLKTDLPMYRIYQNGKLTKEVTDCTPYYPHDGVAFLIGCSFTCDAALLQAGIYLRYIDEQCKSNVPMYNTNIPCIPAGKFSGNMVVSMKPISCRDVAKEVMVTSKFPKAHGGPVCVGCPESIGIDDLDRPDYGDRVEVEDGEVPVFHACGVTAQNVLVQSGVEFAITHSPGCMFITDLKG